MIGISLSSDQIRTAPAEVRRWIEREVMTSLGLQAAPADSRPQGEHLVACSEEQAAAVLSQIQDVLPAVNVFFEFGRQGAIFGQAGIEAFRLVDIAHHTRLADISQVVACIDLINQAFGRACSDASAKLCGFDHEGRCFIAAETQQNILRLWQKVVAGQQLASSQKRQPASVREPDEATASSTEADELPGPIAD